ncbi:MAG: preprotein translocase subunit SecE [Clostridium sp.]|jgi:preprotein translocase subunit SecE|nr:preprotein translocase subunit SecE [Clostridium sp.]
MGNATENNTKTPFFKGLKVEFRKISWPNRQAVMKQSIAVVLISIALGFVIACLDYIIQFGVNILTTI